MLGFSEEEPQYMRCEGLKEDLSFCQKVIGPRTKPYCNECLGIPEPILKARHRFWANQEIEKDSQMFKQEMERLKKTLEDSEGKHNAVDN